MLTIRVTSNRRNLALEWNQRAQRTPAVLRAAMGRNLSLVRRRRLLIMLRTIYRRGLRPKGRFTNRLRTSESVFVKGNVFGVTNTAKSKKGYRYAQRRNDMTGYSKRLKMDKTSNFAGLALIETAAERRANIRAAMRQLNRQGAKK